MRKLPILLLICRKYAIPGEDSGSSSIKSSSVILTFITELYFLIINNFFVQCFSPTKSGFHNFSKVWKKLQYYQIIIDCVGAFFKPTHEHLKQLLHTFKSHMQFRARFFGCRRRRARWSCCVAFLVFLLTKSLVHIRSFLSPLHYAPYVRPCP